jgi:hypothetical protein
MLALFRGSTTGHTETASCPGGMDATKTEATPEETEAAVGRQDLFREETNAKNIGPSEDRCEEQRLVVRRRRGVKKRSQDSVGSRQKVSAARKRVIRRAIPAVRKGNIRKGPCKSSTARGAPKGRRLQKTQQIGQKYKTGIWGCNLKKQLSLRMRKKSGGNSKKTTRLEMVNLIFGSTSGIQDVNYWTFWKVRPPPKCKKDVQTAQGPEALEHWSL